MLTMLVKSTRDKAIVEIEGNTVCPGVNMIQLHLEGVNNTTTETRGQEEVRLTAAQSPYFAMKGLLPLRKGASKL